jgi:hypothetical protein
MYFIPTGKYCFKPIVAAGLFLPGIHSNLHKKEWWTLVDDFRTFPLGYFSPNISFLDEFSRD